MANADRPMGLSPVKHITGAPYNGQANLYVIAAAETTAFAIGDPVACSSVSAGGDSKGRPRIKLGVAGAALRGVIVGIFDNESLNKIDNLNSLVRPAAAQSKDWYALVVDDPEVVFEVQEVSGGVALTAAAAGLNANLIAGTNNGYTSGWELNNVGADTESTLQVKILGLVQRADNEIGQHAKWLVKINNHEFSAGTGYATP